MQSSKLPTTPTIELEIAFEESLGRPRPLWRETLDALLRKPSAVAGMVMLGLLVLVAVFAPLIATHDPNKVLLDIPEEGVVKRLPPCIHLLGCPKAGEDLVSISTDRQFTDSALNSTGSQILITNGSEIEVWKVSDGRKLFTLPHDAPVTTAAWSSNEQRILSASGEQLYLWDVEKKAIVETLIHEGGARFVVWTSDGYHFATAGVRDIHFWVDCKQISYTPACTGRPQGTTFVDEGVGILDEDWTVIQWNKNGTLLMVASGNKVQLWSSAGGVVRASTTFEHDAPVISARFNREANRILTVAGKKAYIWQISSPGEPLLVFEHDRQLTNAAWSEQTRKGVFHVRVLGTSDDAMVVWDTVSGKVVGRFSPGDATLLGGAASPMGTRYFGYSQDTVYVWDADSSELLFSRRLNDTIQKVVWGNTGGSIVVTALQTLKIIKTSNFQYIMGTDGNIRDEFSRLIYASRISLQVGVASVSFAIVLGTFLGAVAGYLGGWVDNVIMRIMDVVLAFPSLILAIAVVTILGPGLMNALIAISIVFIPVYARVARSGVLAVKEYDFVMADRALGVTPIRILFRRILPNVLAPLIVQATLGIGTAILDAAALSFLGLGAQPPTAEWGAMLSDERNQLFTAPHLVFYPGLAIMIVVLAFNLLGDGLRDALDPRLNR